MLLKLFESELKHAMKEKKITVPLKQALWKQKQYAIGINSNIATATAIDISSNMIHHLSEIELDVCCTLLVLLLQVIQFM